MSEQSEGMWQHRRSFGSPSRERKNFGEVHQRVGVRVQEVACLRDRDSLPSEFFRGFVRALPREHLRLHAAPDDLRMHIVGTSSLCGLLRELSRFLVPASAVDGLGQHAGVRKKWLFSPIRLSFS